MISPALQTVIGTLLAAVITGFVTYLVARTGAKSTQESAEMASAVSWAADLTKRIESLEANVAKLQEELTVQQRLTRAFAVFVDRIGLWFEGDQKHPKPIPPAVIQEYIDMTLWPHNDKVDYHD